MDALEVGLMSKFWALTVVEGYICNVLIFCSSEYNSYSIITYS